MTTESTPATRRMRNATLGWMAVLAFNVLVLINRGGVSSRSLLFSALMLIPLLLPLRGILQGDRRTYAWANLCIVPYIIYGIVAATSNPGSRWSAFALLGGGIGLFAALVGYLRASRS
jgi:uncharacterized membrane protein